jgi:hypothetical protein
MPLDGFLPFPNFADSRQDNLPVRIRVHFDWVQDLLHEDFQSALNLPFVRYLYEVQLGGQPNRPQKHILSEELRLQPPSGKSLRIFERNEKGEVQTSPRFPIKGLSHILSILRPDVSLTSTLAQFQHRPTLTFLAWAKRISANILIEKLEAEDSAIVGYYAQFPPMMEELNKVIQRADLGIRSLSIEKSALGPTAFLSHHGLDRQLAFQEESQGTKNFIKAFPHIKEALRTGGLAVLDELDSTIHPALLPEILRWFHDPKENPRNAQLWFSAHSASLLEDLKKEEIFFTEKDQQGRTKIYGLGDIESVRRSDNFYQKYLGGVYGAVPRIG